MRWKISQCWLDDMKVIQPVETYATCPEGFCSETSEGRKPRQNWLINIHLKMAVKPEEEEGDRS